MKQPEMSFLEWTNRFATQEACLAEIARHRWLAGFLCPHCGHDRAYGVNGRMILGSGRSAMSRTLAMFWVRLADFRRFVHFPVANQTQMGNQFHARWQGAMQVPLRLRSLERIGKTMGNAM